MEVSLETAEKRNLELVQRQKDNKEQLQNALAEARKVIQTPRRIVISISEASRNKNEATSDLLGAEKILRDFREEERDASD